MRLSPFLALIFLQVCKIHFTGLTKIWFLNSMKKKLIWTKIILTNKTLMIKKVNWFKNKIRFTIVTTISLYRFLFQRMLTLTKIKTRSVNSNLKRIGFLALLRRKKLPTKRTRMMINWGIVASNFIQFCKIVLTRQTKIGFRFLFRKKQLLIATKNVLKKLKEWLGRINANHKILDKDSWKILQQHLVCQEDIRRFHKKSSKHAAMFLVPKMKFLCLIWQSTWKNRQFFKSGYVYSFKI